MYQSVRISENLFQPVKLLDFNPYLQKAQTSASSCPAPPLVSKLAARLQDIKPQGNLKMNVSLGCVQILAWALSFGTTAHDRLPSVLLAKTLFLLFNNKKLFTINKKNTDVILDHKRDD